jgi:glyoxylase-like metal-dependent hydrolase (beta-lactamase superfamily II)/rhodanese-related sulfurtransferase
MDHAPAAPAARRAGDQRESEETDMYFKQILNDDFGCSSYVVASRRTREAAVIDPSDDIRQYTDLARDRGYRITHVIDTHIHADHVSGNRALAEATGAELYLHASADVLFPFRPLHDGDEVGLGQVVLRVVHTPGHRPEAVSLLVVNPPRSPEPSMVLSGDTLFVGDVGRPDFGGPAGARQQYASVRCLLALDDYVEVFPAHFEGACGRGMCGRPSSTIGFERRFNPVLQLAEPDFLRLAAEASPRPLNMTAILATNRGAMRGERLIPDGDHAVPSIGVAEARAWLAGRDAWILDVREVREYAAAYIPGAHPLPQADLALRVGEIPRDRDVLVVCASGIRSRRAAGYLAWLGYTRITNLDGGTDGWIAAGHPVRRVPSGP